MEEDVDLVKRIENCLSGSGCTNLWELRMAFDFLRERLAILHKDNVTIKDITGEVSRRMYAVNISKETE